MILLRTPIDEKQISKLKVGQKVILSGDIYTARDQAHKKLVDLIKKNKKLPFNLKGNIIYYCGPTQTPKGKIIGSCGPTTSLRMDGFAEPLLKKGLAGMIGKGRRSKNLKEVIKKHKVIYFLAPSGCGALLAKKVVSKKLVAFADLGPEAIYKLRVKDFPLVVAINVAGADIYKDL